MNKNGSRLAYVILGIYSFLGIGTAAATPIPQQRDQQIDAVNQTTPLYLQLGVDVMQKMSHGNDMKLVHHNHWSHSDHGSHYAHYAHRAHYSHYNYY